MKVAIEQHSNGTYYLRYTPPGSKRRVRRSTHCVDLVDAEIERRRVENLLRQGKDPETVKLTAERKVQQNRTSLRDIKAEFRRLHCAGFSSSTLRLYEGNFKNLEKLLIGRATLVDLPMVDISRGLVNSFIDYRLADGLERATVNRDLQYLFAVLNYSVKTGHVPVNPVAGMEKLKENNKRDIRNLQPVDLSPLIESLPYPLNDMVEFLYYSWRRLEEVMALRFEDIRQVDFPTKHRVARYRVKGGKWQEYPLSSMALEIIGRQNRKAEYVFTNPRTGTRYRSLHKTFDKHVKRLELCTADGQKLNRHDLRRIAATDAGRRGVGNDVIAACLGHSLKGVTGRYVSEASVPLDVFEGQTKIIKKEAPAVGSAEASMG